MRFRVWAPNARSSVTLLLDGAPHAMERRPATAGGRPTGAAAPGALYAFALDGGEPRADPRALSLPDGPEGPAEVDRPRRASRGGRRLGRRRSCRAA